MADPQPLPELSPFLAEIAATGPEIERARRMPDDLARRMAAAGLFRMLVPETYGGGEVHPQVFFDTLAATARADGAVGWVLMIGAPTGVMAASLPDEWSRTLYGDHPDNITSGVTAPSGRAAPVEGGMRVSGRWPFGSGSQVSQWICGGCLVMDGETPRQGPHGPQSLLMFFPREAVTIHEDTWFTSGLCGTGSHDIEVADVFVPEGRWVELGRRARVDAPLYRFPTLGLLAIGVSAVAVGIAERAIEAFIELATKKTPTGSRRSLAERSSAQKDLARAEAFYHAGLGLDKVVWGYPGALFLSAGGYHHHLGVNTWAAGAEPAGESDARLLEWEMVLPGQGDVQAALASLEASGATVEGDSAGGLVRDPWGTALRLIPARATPAPTART